MSACRSPTPSCLSDAAVEVAGPFEGVYFQTVPVTITAVPAKGRVRTTGCPTDERRPARTNDPRGLHVRCTWVRDVPGMTPSVLVHLGATFHVATVDLDTVDLALVAAPTIEAVRATAGDRLLAATNAGIFHAPERPVGLLVVDGVEQWPLETGAGAGNFFLKPNGVFWVDEAGAHVAETGAYAPTGAVRLATQSGPLLVAGGELHPAFVEHSPNRKLRSGVGAADDGRVHLVVSEGEVSLWQLATLFRDVLGGCDALYLDGTISGLWGTGLPGGPEGERYSAFVVVLAR